MRLNFSQLSDPMQNRRGQVGMPGTPLPAWLSTSPNMPQTLGTNGDTPIAGVRNAPNMSPVVPILSPKVGTLKPSISAVSPLSPVVPTENSKTEIDREAFEERAAIMEFDGGLSRAEAERRAAELNERGLK